MKANVRLLFATSLVALCLPLNEENVRVLLAAGADRKPTISGDTADRVAERQATRLAREIREYAGTPK